MLTRVRSRAVPPVIFLARTGDQDGVEPDGVPRSTAAAVARKTKSALAVSGWKRQWAPEFAASAIEMSLADASAKCGRVRTGACAASTTSAGRSRPVVHPATSSIPAQVPRRQRNPKLNSPPLSPAPSGLHGWQGRASSRVGFLLATPTSLRNEHLIGKRARQP